MSNEFQYGHDNDDDVLYGELRNTAKQVRDVVASEWDTHPASGSLDDYDIGTGTASGGLWSADMPSGVSAGFYILQMRIRLTGTPDCSDPIIGWKKGYWNGTVFAELSLTVAGQVDVGQWLGSAVTKNASNLPDINAKEISDSAAAANSVEANIDNLNATVSSRSSHTAASVWSVGTRTLTSFGTLITDIWHHLLTSITTAGSIGKLIKDNLNATISSRAPEAGGNIATILTNTNRVDGLIEDSGGDRFTQKALEQAPTGGSANVELAARVIINKAVQTKATGVIQYYDDAGSGVVLTHTPVDGGTTITRNKS